MTNMNRRGFLSLLGLAPAALIVPKKTFFFFGEELYRPPTICTVNGREFSSLQAAFDYLPKGGTVILKPGTHAIGQRYRIPEHFTLYGSIGFEEGEPCSFINNSLHADHRDFKEKK